MIVMLKKWQDSTPNKRSKSMKTPVRITKMSKTKRLKRLKLKTARQNKAKKRTKRWIPIARKKPSLNRRSCPERMPSKSNCKMKQKSD